MGKKVGQTLTSANSCVSLKGELSKPRLRGEHERMNPKSMWIIWPSPSRRMLPLCLKQQHNGTIKLSESPYTNAFFDAVKHPICLRKRGIHKLSKQEVTCLWLAWSNTPDSMQHNSAQNYAGHLETLLSWRPHVPEIKKEKAMKQTIRNFLTRVKK